MMHTFARVLLAALLATSAAGFSFVGLPTVVQTRNNAVSFHKQRSTTITTSMVANMMPGEDAELKKASRAQRVASADDRVVEIRKPLGLVLEEDMRGDVYVAEVLPGGNADWGGQINVGDKIVFVSATFGEEVWSSRGVGLSRVQAAIRVRQGKSVTLVLENGEESKKKAAAAAMSAAERRELEDREQEKKDRLLAALDADTQRRKKGKLFGLF